MNGPPKKSAAATPRSQLLNYLEDTTSQRRVQGLRSQLFFQSRREITDWLCATYLKEAA
jgi:hypothetical protein